MGGRPGPLPRRSGSMSPADGPTTLADYLAVLRRRKRIIGLVVGFALVAAAGFSIRQSPSYQAEAQVVLDRANIVPAISRVTDPATLGTDPHRFLETQSDVARSPLLAQRVVRAARIPGLTVSGFIDDSKATAAANADILNVSVVRPNRDEAIKLTNVYASEFTAFKTDFDTAKIDEAVTALRARLRDLSRRGQRGSDLYATLLENEINLETVGKLLASNAQVLKPADDAAQISPQTKRNVLIGGIVGAVFAVGLALLAEALDRRVRFEDEIGESLGIPLLARIPRPPARLQRANQPVMLAEPTSAEAAAFRVLRTSFEAVNVDRHARTIMVTSSVAGEGKTTTIANLAIALARGGRRVALVDFDLSRPHLHELFRLHPVPGLTDLLFERASLYEVLRPIPISRRARSKGSSNSSDGHGGGRGNFCLIPVGAASDATDELVGNERATALIEQLARQFDYVLFDVPPLLGFGEPMALSRSIDAILVVTRLGTLQRELLQNLARQLELCPADTLGYVLTGAELEESYGRYYGSAQGEVADFSPRQFAAPRPKA